MRQMNLVDQFTASDVCDIDVTRDLRLPCRSRTADLFGQQLARMSVHRARRDIERGDCRPNGHDQPLAHFIQHQPVDRPDREYRVTVLDPAMVSSRDLADQSLNISRHWVSSLPADSASPVAQTGFAESCEDAVCSST